jgi:hypothetical protein
MAKQNTSIFYFFLLIAFAAILFAAANSLSNTSENLEKDAAQAFCDKQPRRCECTVHVSQGRYEKHYYATYKYGGKWFTKEF